KLNFPPYPTGKWEIHVLTEANQVIGILRFTVVKANRSQPVIENNIDDAPTQMESINGNISEKNEQEINKPEPDSSSDIIDASQETNEAVENNEPEELQFNESAETIEPAEPTEAKETEIEIIDSPATGE